MDRRTFIEALVAGAGVQLSTFGSKTRPIQLPKDPKSDCVKSGENIYTAKVLRLEKPTVNGRVYSRALIEKLVKDKSAFPMIGIIDNAVFFFDKIPLHLASHTIHDPRIEGDYLVVDIKPLDTPEGKKLLKMLQQDEVAFRTVGKGSLQLVDDKVAVVEEDFKLTSINAYDKTEASAL